ncbi:NosD domain-containing protein, partial [Nanoarchaeota archaeon]
RAFDKEYTSLYAYYKWYNRFDEVNITGCDIGIDLTNYGSSNYVYNSYFNNTININSTLSNFFNTTLTSGTNIIGRSQIGGNYWATPTGTGFSESCANGNNDTFCDNPYTISSGNLDYLPLTFVQNYAPNITQILINSSSPGYNLSSNDLNCYARAFDKEYTSLYAYYKWYNNSVEVPSFAGSASITNGTASLASIVDSQYTTVGENWTCAVLAGDGFLNDTVWTNATIFIVQPTPPVVTLISPTPSQNVNLTTPTFVYNVTDASNISYCNISFDSQANQSNTSITKDTNQTFTQFLANGTHTWNINCTDIQGTEGNSTTESFDIIAQLLASET